MADPKPTVQGPRISIPFNRGGGVLYDTEAVTTPVLNNLYHTEYLFGQPFAPPSNDHLFITNAVNATNLLTTFEWLAPLSGSFMLNSNFGTNLQSYLEYITSNNAINYIINSKSDKNTQSYSDILTSMILDTHYLINSGTNENVQSYMDMLTNIALSINYIINSSTDNNVQSSMDEHINPFHMTDTVTFNNT